MAQRRLKKLSTPSMANTTTAAVANDNHHMTAAPDMTTNGIKCVELMRTARGFGFTLSGEMPSILTHVKGVAHQSGLRSGDYLMTVHDMDVLNITHDRIVELIQRTAGSLRLRCLASDGNYLSSNTSDEGEEDADYRHVADTDDNHRIHGSHRKSRPPSAASQTLSSSAHRHHRHHRPDSTGGRRHHRTAAKVYNDLADNALTAGRSRGLPALDRLVLPSPHVHHMGGHRLPVHHRAFKSNEPLIDLLLEQKLSQIQCNISESDSNNSYKSNSLTKSYNYNNSNNNNSNKCKTLLSRKSSAISDETQTMGADGSVGAAPPMRRTTSETNVGSISRALNCDDMSNAGGGGDDDEDLHSRALLRAIVGYLGTIETPADGHIDAHLIKDCIRRIRVENKCQTQHLLAVYQDSVHLVNGRGRTIAQFAADSLKSCGICADDQKYFAIITANTATGAAATADTGDASGSYSCHVFTTGATTHQQHYKTAQNFGIKCTLDPVSGHCLEFPESSDSILRVIVGLYRHKVGCAPSAMATVAHSPPGARHNSASNSDSGITEENSRSPDANHTVPPVSRNQSYNSERLEAQLNAANVRQTVHKYLKLKHDLKTIGFPTDPQMGGQKAPVDSELSANDCKQRLESNEGSMFKAPRGSAYSLASNGKPVMPATLSKENLELNNEITSGYDLDTKSSMSLEGMPPMSDTVSAASASVVSERPVDVGWVGGWAQDFEKLLSDSVGLKVFAEFLKKEFSHENLQFWMACEKYKLLTDSAQLRTEAKALYDRHLCTGAPEAVNIDGRARLIVETAMDEPTPGLFAAAEKQIYNLMKFDCYQRFLKSNIYKECVSMELQGRALPYECSTAPGVDSDGTGDDNHRFKNTQINTIKPKKRSFIPWHRIKSSKAEKQQLKRLNAKQTYVRCKSACDHHNSGASSVTNRSDVTGSQSSLATSDQQSMNGRQKAMYLMSKSKESLDKMGRAVTPAPAGNGSHHCQDDDCHLLCVLLPDRSQTVVPLVDGQTVGQMVEGLLRKRGLNYSAFDAFVTGSDKSLDPTLDVSTLGCNEVRVEQRVLFEIDFPNREVIGIKARTSKSCGDVFGPLLAKYGYKLEHIVLQIANSSEVVTNDMPIARLDNQRIIVSISDDLEEWGWDCVSSRMPVAVDKSRTVVSSPSTATDDDKPIRVLNDSLFDKHSDKTSSSEKENRLPVPTVADSTGAGGVGSAVKEALADSRLAIDGQNVSFSDDTKSEQFFRDLMLASQHLPVHSPINSLKSCAKTMPAPIAPAVKPSMRRAINSQYYTNGAINGPLDGESALMACDLSPIEPSYRSTTTSRCSQQQPVLNDIDLDATLKSIQLYNMRNADKTMSPSGIPYPQQPALTTDALLDVSAPDFTPPPPVRTMPLTSKHYKQLAPTFAPPLPPKPLGAGRPDRGPPPRPPSARHMTVNANTNNSFVRSLDKTIDSSVIFV